MVTEEEVFELFSILAKETDAEKEIGRISIHDGKEELQIYLRDLNTLRFGEYLNDNVVNCYLEMIANKCNAQSEGPKKVYAISSFFFGKLSKAEPSEGDHERASRWFRNVDLFEYKILLVPICVERHWFLVLIDFQRRFLIYYNSAWFENSNVEERRCVMYMHPIWKFINYLAKKKLGIENFCQSFQVLSQNTPRQRNHTDCGVFVCQFANSYCQEDLSSQFHQEDMYDIRIQMAVELVCGASCLNDIETELSCFKLEDAG